MGFVEHGIVKAYELGEVESEIIGRIYDAALDAHKWLSILQSLKEICNADQCTLFFYDAQSRSRNFALATKTVDGIIDKYLRDFIDIEAADFHQQLRQLKEGEVVTPLELVKTTGKYYDEIVGDEYMQTFMPNLKFQAGIILLHQDMTCSGLGLRSFAEACDLDKNTVEFLKRLSPHMVQAMKIHCHVSRITHTNHAIEEVLKRINTGVFLLDSNLKVIFSNAEAARLLESSATVNIGRQGKLFLSQPEEDRQLQQVLNALTQEGFKSPELLNTGIDLVAHPQTDAPPLKIRLLPLQTAIDNELSKAGITLAVFAFDPARPCTVPDEYLRQAYALTPTECNILKALIGNSSIKDIAKQRGTSLETARGQIKNIMQKTSTHSQAELSRLLVALGSDCGD